MLPQTSLKRQAEDVSFHNDDLVDDVYNNVTWGGKKSRYHYTCTLQSQSDLFENNDDSDQTESVHTDRIQSTIEVAEKLDFSSDSSCENDSDCSCENYSDSSCENYSDSSCKNDSDCDCCQSSSHSDFTEYEVSRNELPSNDNGYSPDDTEGGIQLSTPGTKELYPCFKTCLMCKANNTNPYFQYCHKCFRFRLQLFESYPDPQPKSIKRLNLMVNHAQENKALKDSQESCVSNSQESGSFGISGLWLSQETDKSENIVNACNICLVRTKNALFNHGKTSHIYSCYTCSKLVWSRTGKCPICNQKIRNVTKVINV